MAQTRVFVDDAVLGRLPQVCVKDGVATTSHLSVDQEVGGAGGPGALWLLLLFGPVGWLLLALVAGRGGGEHLVIELPLSRDAYARLRAARSVRNRGLLLAGGGVAVGVVVGVTLEVDALAALLAGLALVVGFSVAGTGALHVVRESVAVSLDGSRRWVTLDRVHPSFAAACAERYRSAPVP